jgi:hypothetical protein
MDFAFQVRGRATQAKAFAPLSSGLRFISGALFGLKPSRIYGCADFFCAPRRATLFIDTLPRAYLGGRRVDLIHLHRLTRCILGRCLPENQKISKIFFKFFQFFFILEQAPRICAPYIVSKIFFL